MTIAARGLTVGVARPADLRVDCTNGGISANHDRLTIVGVLDERDPRQPLTRAIPVECRVFEPTAEAPQALLRVRAPFGPDRLLVDVVPVAAAEGGWYQNGGNLATWS